MKTVELFLAGTGNKPGIIFCASPSRCAQVAADLNKPRATTFAISVHGNTRGSGPITETIQTRALERWQTGNSRVLVTSVSSAPLTPHL